MKSLRHGKLDIYAFYLSYLDRLLLCKFPEKVYYFSHLVSIPFLSYNKPQAPFRELTVLAAWIIKVPLKINRLRRQNWF